MAARAIFYASLTFALVDSMIQIAIIVGSTRPGRNAEAVAHWVHKISEKRPDAKFEVVDLRDFNLPLLDEPMSARYVSMTNSQYANEYTRAWSSKISRFDGFIFVTPEYNHGIPGALKNAIDYLYGEWSNKAAGIVSYGAAGGLRAVSQLRLVLVEVQMASVSAEVNLSVYNDFENYKTFKPDPMHEERVKAMLDQLVAWSGALKNLRRN
jgi:NAD(P)H-dependent FMN reductase